MQSIFQHRHLREAVERDLSACQAKPHKSATGSSTPEITLVSDNEKEGDATTPTPMVAGVQASRPAEGDGKITFLVGWKDDDIHNPRNWSLVKKWWTTIIVTLIGGALCIPSSIEAPVTNAFDEYYNVGPIAGSMTTGIYLIGFGVGSLFAGPFSETFGRNLVYIGSIVLFMIFTMAKALAPNFGAAIAFRFLAAFFGSPPLTCTGGSIADIWNPLHITFGLPFYTMVAYAGPIAGPIIGAYLPGVGFRWADWISLIISGAMLIVVILALPETYSPLLLEWKASHFRELTGDSRYQVNEHASLRTLGQHLITNVYRPFLMTYTEPIILVFSFYLTILYIVLFTFLNGYPYIFQETYGITEPLTYILWCGMLAGDGVALMLIPVVYGWTKKAVAKAEANGKEVEPEVCMYWSMMGGSFFLPISLFWMGWTCYVRAPFHPSLL
ncbi:MFS general substrate transporter [Whalleya microplaca]|nr:MFS general substrate transporter [Whalleya microplaca]